MASNDWNFELIAGPYGGVTEGPAWDGETLLFTHIPKGLILRYDPQKGDVTEFRRYTNYTNGLAFSAEGELYGCQMGSRRIVHFKRDGSVAQLAFRLDGRFHNQPNDLAIDAENRIWFSDTKGQTFPMSGQLPLLEHASVLRLDPGREWSLRRMTQDITGPNGVLLSKDGRTLYVAENNRTLDLRQLRAYPVLADGTLGPGAVLHTFGSDHRGPQRGIDGMCLDSEGNIVACAGVEGAGPGPMVYVFSPEGQVLESHRMPVDRPTNCTFGDPDQRTLYITTVEGHLFRVRNTGRQGWLIWPQPR